MGWLELLARQLDGDAPALVLWAGPLGPGGVNVWWSEDSLPAVFCPLELWEMVHGQLLAVFGEDLMVAYEGEA